MKLNKTIKRRAVIWSCPRCKRAVSQVEYNQLRFDFKCPGLQGRRCDKYMSDYNRLEKDIQ